MRQLVAVALIALLVGLAVPVEAGSNWFRGKNRIERLERKVAGIERRLEGLWCASLDYEEQLNDPWCRIGIPTPVDPPTRSP